MHRHDLFLTDLAESLVAGGAEPKSELIEIGRPSDGSDASTRSNTGPRCSEMRPSVDCFGVRKGQT
jgi:hypothetical protein